MARIGGESSQRGIVDVLDPPVRRLFGLVATIARAGYPDPFAWKKGHKYFDEGSSKDKPIWYAVDIAFVEKFPEIVSLETLKQTKGLEKMVVTQKGSRLSVQPVTWAEYDIVARLGRRKR